MNLTPLCKVLSPTYNLKEETWIIDHQFRFCSTYQIEKKSSTLAPPHLPHHYSLKISRWFKNHCNLLIEQKVPRNKCHRNFLVTKTNRGNVSTIGVKLENAFSKFPPFTIMSWGLKSAVLRPVVTKIFSENFQWEGSYWPRFLLNHECKLMRWR